ncbi:MAG TPA: UTP--glucose-1-phosphate uridylyltransferase [Myxococcota bacterium]|nr:UTP--glucose-1-phosphate uridylyltransferase [Myxococcota bacterium]
MASSNRAVPDIRALRARLEEYDQGHVLRFWDRLVPDAQRGLAEQIGALDLPSLMRGYRSTQRSDTARAGSLAPPAVEALPERGGDAARRTEAREHGEAMLREGRVALMVVAGGQGSRLGFEGPKGLYPLGPVTGRTLFALQSQRIRRLRERTRAAIPWYVMTSDATDDATRCAFAEAGYFGLPARDVFFLRQGMVASLDFEGRLILERTDRIFANPDGHGGSLTALLASGALDDMERRGITSIFYYQVDNPMLALGDPILLGFHARSGAEVSCKSLRKREPAEKMGVFARIDGRIGVVEYTEIAPEQRDARDDRGGLVYDAGNLAVHVFEVDFVRRVAAAAERWLPWHASAKKIPTIDAAGAPLSPAEPNGLKLERFVFDALHAAETVCIVEASRDEYGPVKNATGDDSPESSRRLLSQRYWRWIEDAGLRAPSPAHSIEIDESRIGSPEDLRALGIAAIGDAPDQIHTRPGGDA